MTGHALFRTYPNGLQARITPRGHSFMLELFDDRGRRKPDLPVIASSLEEAQQLADDIEHAVAERHAHLVQLQQETRKNFSLDNRLAIH